MNTCPANRHILDKIIRGLGVYNVVSSNRSEQLSPEMAAHSSLEFVLTDFYALNVTGRVPREPRVVVGHGGFSDIFKGSLVYHPATPATGDKEEDGEELQVVAIKSIRASLKNDKTFEKVNTFEFYPIT